MTVMIVIAPNIDFKVLDSKRVYTGNMSNSEINGIVKRTNTYEYEIETVRRFNENVSNRKELLQLI